MMSQNYQQRVKIHYKMTTVMKGWHHKMHQYICLVNTGKL